MERRFDMNEALKALAHPGRFEFLVWLKDPQPNFGLSSSEARDGVSARLFEQSGLSQSAASAHLAVLSRAGLLSSRRSGGRVLYSRNEANISLLKSTLENML